MPMPPHKHRSWLFAPADDARKTEKALSTDADVVILDLEDAVSPQRKAEGRAMAANGLKLESSSARYVRVNGLDTGLTNLDVAQTIAGSPDGYLLPKCEGPQDIDCLAAMIRAHDPKESPGIVAICSETVRAVRNLMRLDWAHPLLTGLTWGGEDLQADLGALANRDRDNSYLSPFATARDLALFAAKDAGVLAIDSVYTDFRDEAGLASETQQARAVGFDGKLAIHPAQIDPIHRQLAPTKNELDWAHRVIETLQAAGDGVAQLDGKMLDRPHLKLAEKILRSASD
ncbi:HpcH/HpaI aldolase/citrate lyase family protein [Roseibium sp. SCP14]|uniref:HpcH/HpaI aldolase/citrate lyase family protein n=1 Tax=Roseibium sp. SCP14 TaxID=3141375 RepID=UPI003338196C